MLYNAQAAAQHNLQQLNALITEAESKECHLPQSQGHTTCTTHIDVRIMQKLKKAKDGTKGLADICPACNDCAFCRPVMKGCWGQHLPVQVWNSELDKKINEPQVRAKLLAHNCKHVSNAKRIRQLVLDTMYEVEQSTTPTSEAEASPIRARLRDVAREKLAPDAYTQEESDFPQNDIQKLAALNEMLLLPTNGDHKCSTPVTIDDLKKKEYLTRVARNYCKKVLAIMVPGEGQAALDVVLQKNKQHAGLCKRVVQQSDLQLDKMVRLYLFTPRDAIRELTFIQLCGLLSNPEFNQRLKKQLKKEKDTRLSLYKLPPVHIKKQRFATGGITR
jgi:hypothetical protein